MQKFMKHLIPVFFVFSLMAAQAQKENKVSDAFTITGKIRHEITINLSDLDTFATQSLNDIVITNHLGEKKNVATHVKGIPFKNILMRVELDAENPKVMSEYYFVFTANDGYKIVFSWNEIFNSSTGNNIYVITEKDGKKLRELDDRILMVCTSDFATGRRYLKSLAKITVFRAQ